MTQKSVFSKEFGPGEHFWLSPRGKKGGFYPFLSELDFPLALSTLIALQYSFYVNFTSETYVTLAQELH